MIDKIKEILEDELPKYQVEVLFPAIKREIVKMLPEKDTYKRSVESHEDIRSGWNCCINEMRRRLDD